MKELALTAFLALAVFGAAVICGSIAGRFK